MKRTGLCFISFLSIFVLSSCATYETPQNLTIDYSSDYSYDYLPSPSPPMLSSYESRLPERIASGEKTVLVDPNQHAWGAYDDDGTLIRAGLASAGANWCPDIGRPCHTNAGSFRVFSLGSPGCKSKSFPIPKGGAPMPYCMYFKNGQALHGVSNNEIGEGNFSHGCVRLHTADAEWLRYNFVTIGTRVVVEPY